MRTLVHLPLPTTLDHSHSLQRFARELKVWARLDHPNLLKLQAFSISKELLYARFYCPFHRHGHVGLYLQANNPDEEKRWNLVRTSAYENSHKYSSVSTGFGHSQRPEISARSSNRSRRPERGASIKPSLSPNSIRLPFQSNVLVDFNEQALLCDYGLANAIDEVSGMTTSSSAMSVRWASPEVMNGAVRDLSSDMWSWGCLFMMVRATLVSMHDP